MARKTTEPETKPYADPWRDVTLEVILGPQHGMIAKALAADEDFVTVGDLADYLRDTHTLSGIISINDDDENTLREAILRFRHERGGAVLAEFPAEWLEPEASEAVPAQGPESSPPAEAPNPKALFELSDAIAEADRLALAKLDAAEKAKAAKAAHETALERVLDLSRRLCNPEPMPLFDKPKESAGDRTIDDPADDRLATRLDTLGLKPGVLKALAEAKVNGKGIETVGDLAAYTATDAPLTMIRGIGEAAAEAIIGALDAFWAASPDAEAVVAAATAAIDEEAA